MNSAHQEVFVKLVELINGDDVVTGRGLIEILSPLSVSRYSESEIKCIQDIKIVNDFVAINVNCSEYDFGEVLTLIWRILDTKVKHFVVVGGCRGGKRIPERMHHLQNLFNNYYGCAEAPGESEVSVLHIDRFGKEVASWQSAIACENIEQVYSHEAEKELNRLLEQHKARHLVTMAKVREIESRKIDQGVG